MQQTIYKLMHVRTSKLHKVTQQLPPTAPSRHGTAQQPSGPHQRPLHDLPFFTAGSAARHSAVGLPVYFLPLPFPPFASCSTR